jgi:hypothetical protein
MVNSKFEHFGTIVKYRYRLVVTKRSTATVLKYWNIISLLPQAWKDLTCYAKVKNIC